MKKLLSLFLILIIIFVPSSVYAAGEIIETIGGIEEDETTTSQSTIDNNENSSETCKHDFLVVAFNPYTSIVSIECSVCDETQQLNFAQHLSTQAGDENYLNYLDLNSDSYINAKDYIYLLRDYTDLLTYGELKEVLSDKQFMYKEQFYYIYTTVLILIQTVILSIVRRKQ